MRQGRRVVDTDSHPMETGGIWESSGDAPVAGRTRESAEPRLPFFFRWVLDAPVSVWWIAAGVGALQTALGIAVADLAGMLEGLDYQGTPFWNTWVGLIQLVYTAWYAWLPVAIFVLVRGAERDLTALTPLLEGGEEPGRLRADTLSLSPRAFGICIAVAGLLASSSLALLALAEDRIPLSWPWVGGWILLREAIGDMVTAVTLGWGLVVGARLSALVRSRARISLLDTTGLAPLTRNGTRLALVWLVTFSIGIPTLAVPGGRSFVLGALIVTLVGLASAGVAVALPLLGARRRLTELKTTELASVRDAIESARQEALAAPASESGAAAAARLPGLLAWEARVEDAPVWLLDVGALSKLGLYLLIPLASWICGALVERMIDTALS